MAYIVMAYIVMSYRVMAYIVMAYIVMTYIVMAYVVMAYVVMACIVDLKRTQPARSLPRPLRCRPPESIQPLPRHSPIGMPRKVVEKMDDSVLVTAP